ncbi:MAG: hypothetical protein AABY26_05355 [Nanoarchaeota archaeon]
MVCKPHQYTIARIAYPSFQTATYQPVQLYQQASAYATSSNLGLGYNSIGQYSSKKQSNQNYNTSYFNQTETANYNFPTINNSMPFSTPVEFFKPPVKRIAEQESPQRIDAPKQHSIWSQPKTYQTLPLQDYSAHQTTTNQNPSSINRDQLSFLIQAELGNMEVQHVLH